MSQDKYSRRRFMTSCGALGLGSLLEGCCSVYSLLPPCSSLEPDILVPQGLKAMSTQPFVGVDMHCHIFNGYDVPLSEFLTGPVLHFEPPFDALLRLITEPVEAGIRTFAPCASEEYAELCDLVSSQREKAAGIEFSIESAVENEIATDDSNFSEYMARVANGNVEFLRLYRSLEREGMMTLGVRPDQLRKEDERLSPEEILRNVRFEDIKASLKAPAHIRTKASRLWSFLRSFWGRRYHNAYRLLTLYGEGGEGPKVDVFFAAPVDFDVPLKAQPPSSKLEDQLKLMAGISVLTGGRILPYVPFDPHKDILHGGEALRLVKKGVMEYGCVGVKLYPPMGFKAYGNSGQDPGCHWPNGNYGEKLDASLKGLYEWCLECEVPILAHSSESNGVTKACQRLGGPDDWQHALSEFAGLQVSVGHFGGDTAYASQDDYERARGFASLMRESYAEHFYADLSFMPGLFEPNSTLSRIVEEMKGMPVSGAEQATVADRLLYGSDWFMLAFDASALDYARLMQDYLLKIGDESLVAKVFSSNTIELFRLAKRENGKAGKLRNRLDRFFEQHNLHPQWLPRIDSQYA
ncbi:MAG: amidohydrolase family protein [Candidatus Thiodiazotropha sp.]